MRFYLSIVLLFFIFLHAEAQVDSIVIEESKILDLEMLISEVLTNNPEIDAALTQMDIMEAKVPQAGSLMDPELEYMHSESPATEHGAEISTTLKLSQKFTFPTKLSTRTDIAQIQSEHSHHDHLEKVNEVINRLKNAYFELWYIQQATVLMRENLRLMKQFETIATTKYGVGKVPMQDVLKAQVEISKITNTLAEFRGQELSAKSMLTAILNRDEKDTVGYAVVSEEIIFSPSLDTLLTLSTENRNMLKHSYLAITENQTMLSLANQEYIPDFFVSVGRAISPAEMLGGWEVSAGITLPFLWTIDRTSSMVEEAELGIKKATSTYTAQKNMVQNNIKNLYYNITSRKQQLEMYSGNIIPKAELSLSTTLTSYQNGNTDFLMLLDAYKTLTDLRMEYFMLRMNMEQAIAQLELEVGLQNIATLNLPEGNENE